MEIKDNEIYNVRVINFPQAKVFNAFKDPKLLAKWWGPEGFTNTFSAFTFKDGGDWKFIMHGPDGKDYKNETRFIKITEPNQVIFEHIAPHFKMEIDFIAVGDKTQFSFRQIFPTVEDCQRLKAFIGDKNEENFDRLEAVLKSS